MRRGGCEVRSVRAAMAIMNNSCETTQIFAIHVMLIILGEIVLRLDST